MSLQVIITILIAAGSIAYFIPTPQELRDAFASGQNYFAAKNYTKAIEQYDKILATESDFLTADSVFVKLLNGDITVGVRTAAMYQKANALRTLGKTDSAISSFRRVLERHDSPKLRVLSQYQIYDLFFQKKEYDSAIVQARILVKEFPFDEKVEQALYDIGWAFRFKSEYDSSSLAFEMLADKYIESAFRVRSMYQIGQNSLDAKEWRRARNAFHRIVDEYKPETFKKVDFENMELLANRERQIFDAVSNRESDNSNLELVSKSEFKIAESYEQLSLIDSAVARYKYIIRTYTLMPSLIELSYIKMAELLHRVKGLEDAIAAYKKAIDDNFQNKIFQARMQYKIARTYQDAKEYDKSAVEYLFYVKAYSEFADQAEFSTENGRFFAVLNFNAAKNYLQVIAAADSFLQNHAGSEFSPKALIMRGIAFQQRKQFENARKSYEEVLRDYSSAPEARHAKMQIAKTFYDEKNYDEALKKYTALESEISSGSEASEVRYFLGMSLFYLSKLDDALAALQKVESSSQFYPFAFGRCVKIYSAQNKFEQAEKFISAVLENLPDSSQFKPYAHLSYGELLATTGKFDDAIQQMTIALKDTSVNENARFQALYSRGALYQQRKKFNEAIKDLEACLRSEVFLKNFENTIPTANEKLALSYLGSGRKKEAVEKITNLLSQAPSELQRVRYLSSLVELHSQMNEFTKVVEFGLQVVNADSADENTKAKTYAALSNAYGNLNLHDNVVEILSAALEKLPKHPYIADIAYETASLYFEGGGYVFSDKLFMSLLEKHPGYFKAEDALHNRAMSVMKMNKFDDALFLVRAFIQKYPESNKNPALQYSLAETYYNAEKFDIAIREYDVVVKQFSSSLFSHSAAYNKGWCYFRLGDTLRMIESFERFVEKYSNAENAPDALFSIGDYYYNTKQYEKAKKTYLNIVEKYPSYARLDEAKALVKELNQINSYLEYSETMKIFDAQEFAKAIPLLEEIIKKYPDADVRFACEANIASAYSELGNKKKALEMFTAIIKKYSNTPDAQMVVFFAEQHKRWIESGKAQ